MLGPAAEYYLRRRMLGRHVTISVTVVAGPIVVLVVFVATAVAIVVTDHKNQ